MKTQSPNPRNATAGRQLARAYTKQFGQKCEDCGDDALGRRTRCPNCNLLVCGWCYNHVHGNPLNRTHIGPAQAPAKET